MKFCKQFRTSTQTSSILHKSTKLNDTGNNTALKTVRNTQQSTCTFNTCGTILRSLARKNARQDERRHCTQESTVNKTQPDTSRWFHWLAVATLFPSMIISNPSCLNTLWKYLYTHSLATAKAINSLINVSLRCMYTKGVTKPHRQHTSVRHERGVE